jgi:hypothetical protein
MALVIWVAIHDSVHIVVATTNHKACFPSSMRATRIAVVIPILPMFYCVLRCIAFWMDVSLQIIGLAWRKLVPQYDFLLVVSGHPDRFVFDYKAQTCKCPNGEVATATKNGTRILANGDSLQTY